MSPLVPTEPNNFVAVVPFPAGPHEISLARLLGGGMIPAPVARPEACKEQPVRTESDLQGHHHADAPGCHRCGLPLLASTDFCPYCERSIHEGAISRLAHWRPAQRGDIRRPMITETRLLAAGFVIFALIAAASLVAALAT